MLLPVFLVEGADDDSLARAGVDELPVFQVDAHVGGPFLLPPVVEEDEVAFTEFSFLDFPAILLPLVFGVPFEVLPIYLIIYGGSQSRTIHSPFRGSASPIGYAQPLG